MKRSIHNIELVERLSKILFLQISVSTPLYLTYLWFQFVLVNLVRSPLVATIILYAPIVMIILAAILFTPYLLYVLIKERRYVWISTFTITVVIPYPILVLILGDYVLLKAWLLVPVILFYFYCFIIKYSVNDWLREYYAHQQLEEEKKESMLRQTEGEEFLLK